MHGQPGLLMLAEYLVVKWHTSVVAFTLLRYDVDLQAHRVWDSALGVAFIKAVVDQFIEDRIHAFRYPRS